MVHCPSAWDAGWSIARSQRLGLSPEVGGRGDPIGRHEAKSASPGAPWARRGNLLRQRPVRVPMPTDLLSCLLVIASFTPPPAISGTPWPRTVAAGKLGVAPRIAARCLPRRRMAIRTLGLAERGPRRGTAR